ncbi:hypothetical protein [Streptomyces sp. N50]|uniref:LexA family protein n=1 Tax=Streptomyces sp. N50 TaxID=3081765 RepID=UPI0029622B68|nr:hypothetical protein [Streptomyces sp. N50]WOX11494.1 hypothetical protein R2B38_22845 [Streptomyces sp. N50]
MAPALPRPGPDAGGASRAAPPGPHSRGPVANRRPEHLTEREEEIPGVVRRRIAEYGEDPSVRQIAGAVGLKSTSPVAYHLEDLQRVPPGGPPRGARRPGARRTRLANLPPGAPTRTRRRCAGFRSDVPHPLPAGSIGNWCWMPPRPGRGPHN